MKTEINNDARAKIIMGLEIYFEKSGAPPHVITDDEINQLIDQAGIAGQDTSNLWSFYKAKQATDQLKLDLWFSNAARQIEIQLSKKEPQAIPLFLTIEETASLVKHSQKSVRRWIKNIPLQTKRLSRKVLLPRSEVITLLEMGKAA